MSILTSASSRDIVRQRRERQLAPPVDVLLFAARLGAAHPHVAV